MKTPKKTALNQEKVVEKATEFTARYGPQVAAESARRLALLAFGSREQRRFWIDVARSIEDAHP